MKKRWSVGIDEGVWNFRWRWQAKRHFDTVKLKQGQSAIFVKHKRDGTMEVQNERLG